MCGIVGYVGAKNAVKIIMEGLSRLEYRGYDSAGICLKGQQGEFVQYKKVGKLKNLFQVLAGENPSSHIGIGHTRWATHGKVTDFNAHPHGNKIVNLVHNGIIENSKELKSQLEREGYTFHSETDSEVFLALVSKYLKTEQSGRPTSLEEAVSTAFQNIQGNSAFVIMERGSDKIIAIKRAVPIVCGVESEGKNLFVSSDPYALIGYADEVFFPEDDVVCILDRESSEQIRFIELDQSPSDRVFVQKQNHDLHISEKGKFDHYMLKEIYEQPQLIYRLLSFYLRGNGRDLLNRIEGLSPRFFHISACGTAWHAGLCIKNFIEQDNKIPVAVDFASEFRYRTPLLSPQDLALFISQSGETADTLAAHKLCSEHGLKTISIVNVEGSTLFRNSDYNFPIKGGREVGVASSKAFTLMVLTGYLLSKKLAGNDLNQFQSQIEQLAVRIEDVLSKSEQIRAIARDIYQKKGFLYTGRGNYFPIALEGALKLKEIAYVHAEGYAAGELKHGPIALVDDEIVNIALIGPELYEKTLINVEEVCARDGVMVTVAPQGDQALAKISRHCLQLDYSGLGELSPLMLNVVVQLLAYYIAWYKGTDIDQPRNLAKSVTVE